MQLRKGYVVKLIPKVPPPEIEGLSLAGMVIRTDEHTFTLDNHEMFRYSDDEYLVVRLKDKSIWEIGLLRDPRL